MSRDTNAILVWINPVDRDIETGLFENYLRDMKNQGRYVSSHPDAVMKIGTKRVLYELSGTKWSSNAYLHENESTLHEIENRIYCNGYRVIKQYRGNDGIGIYKIGKFNNKFVAVEAFTNNEEVFDCFDELVKYIVFTSKLSVNNPIIETAWNNNLTNGIIRCYFCNSTLAGFGYQEINALYPHKHPKYIKKQRFYLTENCGIFKGLKKILEYEFINDIVDKLKIDRSSLPLIWDADFFINDLAIDDIELCEINASCVSPFPPSSIVFMYDEIKKNLTTAST